MSDIHERWLRINFILLPVPPKIKALDSGKRFFGLLICSSL